MRTGLPSRSWTSSCRTFLSSSRISASFSSSRSSLTRCFPRNPEAPVTTHTSPDSDMFGPKLTFSYTTHTTRQVPLCKMDPGKSNLKTDSVPLRLYLDCMSTLWAASCNKTPTMFLTTLDYLQLRQCPWTYFVPSQAVPCVRGGIPGHGNLSEDWLAVRMLGYLCTEICQGHPQSHWAGTTDKTRQSEGLNQKSLNTPLQPIWSNSSQNNRWNTICCHTFVQKKRYCTIKTMWSILESEGGGGDLLIISLFIYIMNSILCGLFFWCLLFWPTVLSFHWSFTFFVIARLLLSKCLSTLKTFLVLVKWKTEMNAGTVDSSCYWVKYITF